MIYEFGGQLFNEDGTSALASDEAVAGIQALVDMIDEGYIPDYQTISDTAAEELFISGQTCMLYLPTFSAQKVEQAEMENVKLIQIPTAKTQDFLAGSMQYGMNAASEHKDEAWKFLEYLAGEEANDIIGKSGIDLPARLSSQKYYGESFTKFDGQAFVDVIPSARPSETGPAYASDEINSIMNEQIIEIFNKNVEVKEGLEQMAADINAAIEAGK